MQLSGKRKYAHVILPHLECFVRQKAREAAAGAEVQKQCSTALGAVVHALQYLPSESLSLLHQYCTLSASLLKALQVPQLSCVISVSDVSSWLAQIVEASYVRDSSSSIEKRQIAADSLPVADRADCLSLLGRCVLGVSSLLYAESAELLAGHILRLQPDELLGLPSGLSPEELGNACCSLATSRVSCNNPRCVNLSGPTDHKPVSGKACICAGCRTAVYCGQACQRAHWKHHKPVCRKIAAATSGH